MPRIAIMFHRLGPYHLARCAAAGARCRLSALELCAVDDTYAWSTVEGAPRFERITLFRDRDVDREAGRAVDRRVQAALSAADPDVVALPGWSHKGALAGLRWCLRNRRPAVLMSESARRDAVRQPAREATKRRIVRLFSSALVGGAPQRAYARALGLADEAVFEGYDVVANDHFGRGADQARSAPERRRAGLGLPERFFLASARFVPKKNLAGLLEAYARYRQLAGAAAWRLVLLGDGALRAALEQRIERADLAGAVMLPGFVQYGDLPAYYGLAGAFVHASTSEPWGLVVNEAMAAGLPVLVSARCGCAPDLVRDGVNGFTFDPCDGAGLAALMLRIAAMTESERSALGDAGRRIVGTWGPERFADGIMKSAEAALSRPAPRARWSDRLLLAALIRRPAKRAER